MHYERDIVLPFIMKTLPKERWTHLAHLYTGIWHLLSGNFDEALCLMRSRIISYNEHVGGQNTATGGYHETLTVFYLKQLDAFISNHTNCQSFGDYCEAVAHSPLADKDYPFQFYDKEKLMSIQYRAMYVAPTILG